MNNKKAFWIISIIIISSFVFQLYFSFQTDYFSDEISYFHLRQIENLKENNFKPSVYDGLSNGGSDLSLSPLFYYLFFWVGFLGSFKEIILKIIFAALISIIPLFVYLISREISSLPSSLFVSSMAAFLPILFMQSLNKITPYALVLPVMLYLIYCFINANKEKYLKQFIILSIIISWIHPAIMILSLSFVIYLILSYGESVKIPVNKKEIILFFVMVTALIQIVIYHQALSSMGSKIIFQNLPTSLLSEYFRDFNLIDLIYVIGTLPPLWGVLGIFYGFKNIRTMDKNKKEIIILISSFIFTALLLLALKVIKFYIGLVFLGIGLIIISSLSIDKILIRVKNFKFGWALKYYYIIFVLFMIIIVFFSSYAVSSKIIEKTITSEEVFCLESIKNDWVHKDFSVAAPIEEGDYVTYFTGKKNIIDWNLMGVKNIDEKYNNSVDIYKTESSTIALNIANKYNVRHIYLSDSTKNKYNKNLFEKNERCFEKICENNKAEAYRIKC